MKLIKRDLFIKLMYDKDEDYYYILKDNIVIHRFYSASKSLAIKIYDEFRKGLK